MTLSVAHAHSKWSYDGTLALDEWSAIGERAGFDAVLLAEHEETGWTPQRYQEYVDACAAASTVRVRLVPGVEFNQDGYHLLCYGLREWPSRPSTPHALARAVHQQGCLLCLAHPGRYLWSHPASILQAVDAVEVWNSSWVSDGLVGPHPRTLAMAGGKAMLVGQDVHKRKHLCALYVHTPTSDVIGDLGSGRYAFRLGERSWTCGELAHRRAAALAQRARTPLLRGGLHGYRWTKRVMSRTRRGRAIWEAALRTARTSFNLGD